MPRLSHRYRNAGSSRKILQLASPLPIATTRCHVSDARAFTISLYLFAMDFNDLIECKKDGFHQLASFISVRPNFQLTFSRASSNSLQCFLPLTGDIMSTLLSVAVLRGVLSSIPRRSSAPLSMTSATLLPCSVSLFLKYVLPYWFYFKYAF